MLGNAVQKDFLQVTEPRSEAPRSVPNPRVAGHPCFLFAVINTRALSPLSLSLSLSLRCVRLSDDLDRFVRACPNALRRPNVHDSMVFPSDAGQSRRTRYQRDQRTRDRFGVNDFLRKAEILSIEYIRRRVVG